MVRLAEYSRDCLKALRGETGIRYESRHGGTLQLFRTDKQFANTQRDIAVLRAEGVPYALLEANQLVNAEPALTGSAYKLSGGLRLSNDEIGDCQLFTRHLADMAAKKGVAFRYNCQIGALVRNGNRIDGVSCCRDIVRGDAYVMALESYSTAMLKDVVFIPVYPLKGYSLTIPLADEQGAPVYTVLDETYKVAVTRFDRRIRVGEWRKSPDSIPSCCRNAC